MGSLESRLSALVDELLHDGAAIDGSDIMKLARLAAAIGAELEREGCAQVADSRLNEHLYTTNSYHAREAAEAASIAVLIRCRDSK